MIHEKSAGIVIYTLTENIRKYLLLHYPSGHFDFAKGHLEAGESAKQAAIRELKEETGITEFNFKNGFEKKIHYFYHHHSTKQKMSKDVTFFLAETTQTNVEISHEHQGHIWLPFKQAYQKVTFDNAKNILEAAEKFLRSGLKSVITRQK